MAQPGKASRASSSARRVSTSRSFVGSSSSSRLPPAAQELGEMHAVALAAGEPADAGLLVGALEVEAGRVLARVDHPVAHLQLIEPVGDLLPDRLLRVERVARLVDVGELHGVTQLERAGVGGLLAGDHAKQRGLAGAVGADHADDAGAGQLEVQVLDQQALAESLAQVGRGEHAARRGAGPGECGSGPPRASRCAPRRAAARSGPAGPWTSCVGPWDWCAPIRARPRSCAGAPFSERSSCARRACFCSSQLE